MDELELYEQILSLSTPWFVEQVRLNPGTKNVDVFVSCDADKQLGCPKCDAPSPRYDLRQRSWRHLDTCQFPTLIHASIPRVECDRHGVLHVDLHLKLTQDLHLKLTHLLRPDYGLCSFLFASVSFLLVSG